MRYRLRAQPRSLAWMSPRQRGPLKVCVPRHPGVNEEPRARTQRKCSCECERGSSHYRLRGACCACRVGFAALAVTLGADTFFFAAAATGGFPAILGAVCDESLEFGSVACKELDSVACVELGSPEAAVEGDGVDGLLASAGTSCCGVVSLGVVWAGIVSVGEVSFGVVSVGEVSFGVVSFGVVSFGVVSFGVGSVGGVSFGVVSFGVVSVGGVSSPLQ